MPLSNTPLVNGATGGIDQAALAALASFIMPDASVAGVTTVVDALGALVSPASQGTLAAVLAKLSADAATQTTLAAVLAKLSADPATQTTLAAVLAKMIATPATEAKQDAGITLLTTLAGKDFATQATLALLLAKVSADPATQTTLAAILAKMSGDQATQTTLAAVLAKVSADPATQTTLNAILGRFPTALTAAGNLKVSLAEDTAIVPVSATALPLPTGATTEATLALIKAKTDNLDVALSTRTKPTDVQPISATDGAQVTIGAKADAVWDGAAVSVTSQGYWRYIALKIEAVRAAVTGTLAVSGTFFQATQPVSLTALPLPAGAAQDGADITTPTAMPAGGNGIRGWLSAIYTRLNAALAVTGTFWQATQPVSGIFFQATQPVSTVDGAQVTMGAKADAVWDGAAAAVTAQSYWRYMGTKLEAIRALLNGTIAVSGTFWQVTQPVSGTVTAAVAKKATLWATGGPVTRGTGLTTELNALANGAYSAAGTAIDNTTNRDQYCACDILLASLTPTSGANLSIYLVQSLDGTNYEDAPSAADPGTHALVATVLVATGTAAKRVMSPWFYVPPGKFKLVLLNSLGVALNAAGNAVTVYTSNDEAQ